MVQNVETSKSYSINPEEKRKVLENIASSKTALRKHAVGAGKAKPAYILDIDMLFNGGDKAEKKNEDSLTADTTEDARERFREKFLAYKDKFSPSTTDIGNKSAEIVIQDPGDTCLEFSMMLVRDLLDNHVFSEEQEKEVTERLDKYLNAEKYIEKGGKEAFLEYNLMFAGVAAYENDHHTKQHVEKLIAEGKYTGEQYQKVKDFAAELQNRSGVFVSVQISPGSISYSYMGALCSITDKELSFMADHREANEIWTQLAQGSYKNTAEMLQALRDKGLDSVAEAYKEEMDHRDEYDISAPGFDNKNGALWNQTVGYRGEGPADGEALNRLKRTYLGSENARVRYTAEQLNEAYAKGKKESEKINDLPFVDLSEKEGSESEVEKKKKQIESLKKKVKEIEKQINEIRGTNLPNEKKNKMSEKFKKEIETIQMQINDLLNALAELAEK